MPFPKPLVLLTAALALAGCTRTVPTTAGPDYLVYVGTNVGDPAQNSLYLYQLRAATGKLEALGAVPGGANPSYITLAADHRHIYAVSETGTFRGEPGGGVSTLAVDAHTGLPTLQGQQPSRGASPCYVALDRTGHTALVANYVGGNVAALPVQADGLLAAPAFTDQHQPPTGPHPNQDHAHAHCFLPAPDNRYAFAVDLGTDKVLAYKLGRDGQVPPQTAQVAFAARAGAGPRHLTFHPNGHWAYLENELNSTVTALSYDTQAGTFQEIQTLNTLPAGFTGTNSGADVHVSPDGQTLYTSNRGDNSLAVFHIAGNGQLALVQHVSTQGKTPRNFTLDPSGRLLLVANQNSNDIFTYRVDAATGRLTPTGQSVQLPSPMCVVVAEDFRR